MPKTQKDENAFVEETVKAPVKETKKEQKAPAKKPRAPKAPVEKTQKVYIQFGGMEWEVDALLEQVKAAYVAQGHRASAIRDLNVYVKPEDGKAYYTINDKTSGSIDL